MVYTIFTHIFCPIFKSTLPVLSLYICKEYNKLCTLHSFTILNILLSCIA